MSRLARLGTARAWLIGGFCVFAALAFLTVLVLPTSSSGVREEKTHFSEAHAALNAGDYDRAEELVSRIARDDSTWAEAQLVAGEAATRAGRFDAAVEHYRGVPRDGSDTSLTAAFALGEVCREVGRLSEAEAAFSYVLEHDPEHAAANERMAFLLGITGRRWESQPYFLRLIRTGSWELTTLALVGDLERPLEQSDYVRKCARSHADDVLVQAALAADAVANGDPDTARRQLRVVVDRRPDVAAWQAMLGELLVDSDDATFGEWHAALPPSAEEHPDIWYVRGLRARRDGDRKVAARCFWETVRRAPTHRRGNYQLGQILRALGGLDGAAAERFAQRSTQQFELTHALDLVLRSRGRDESAMRQTTELMRLMGRTWEAWAWATTAGKFFPDSSWPHSERAQTSSQLEDDSPYRDDVLNLALGRDLSHLPVFTIDAAASHARGPSTGPQRGRKTSIDFVDEASVVGIDFVYNNGPDPETPGARMFEQTGGGVAVLDYDLDGRPDLYFTQGAAWPTGTISPPVVPGKNDRVYRNLSGKEFSDVTGKCGVANAGFGQGAAAGDFDCDGFSDLYIGNIGRNGLYRNNGDGTLSDVSRACGLEGDDWTASCVLVDLNADGLPDLFDANYVTGPGVYERLCEGKGCSPRNFDGSFDRVHLNRGDGSFHPVDRALSAPTKGLGVVAFWLNDSRRPRLFVSNDQVPNTLFHALGEGDAKEFRLDDDAFSRGLAFNENGLAMAGMGIAADDADGDGRLDLYVTNFKDESNTLYLQDTSGLFVDSTNISGLRAPTVPYVGWGTQFLDADLDGHPDLVAANGHVDDYRDEGGAWQMPSQFFRNSGNGRFVELPEAEIGEYFEKKYLGRGLSRLDWNGDGRMDFAVSNIGSPASLATNRTSGVGRQLTVRLVATSSARDAFGAEVTVVAGGRRWTKQLVAGSGFMACNERTLQFGLADAAAIEELRVNWPSGETTVVGKAPVDAEVLLTQGRTAALVLRRTTDSWNVANR